MKKGMKTIGELKQEVYAHGLNDEIREVFLGVLEDANVASLSEPERALYEANSNAAVITAPALIMPLRTVFCKELRREGHREGQKEKRKAKLKKNWKLPDR